MSYILDALRKADADRERDPARGIHAHPLPALEPARRGVQWPLVAGTLAGLVAVAAAVWLWPAERTAAPTTVAAPTPMPVAVLAPAPAPAPAQVATTQPAPMPVTAPPIAMPAPAPAPAVLPPAPPPVVVAQLAPHTVAASSIAPGPQPGPMPPAAPKPMAAPTPPPIVAAAPAPPPTPAGTTDRILAVGELPPDIQRDLPKLPISGGVFSENAAQRMLIVNGQVANEGAELAPGLVLEQIRPKSAVLKFRGWRYSVAY